MIAYWESKDKQVIMSYVRYPLLDLTLEKKCCSYRVIMTRSLLLRET
jgi:hypothetical protein